VDGDQDGDEVFLRELHAFPGAEGVTGVVSPAGKVSCGHGAVSKLVGRLRSCSFGGGRLVSSGHGYFTPFRLRMVSNSGYPLRPVRYMETSPAMRSMSSRRVSAEAQNSAPSLT